MSRKYQRVDVAWSAHTAGNLKVLYDLPAVNWKGTTEQRQWENLDKQYNMSP